MPDSRSRIPGGTWLGFDFGLRRTGVAVGQTTTCTASPLTTLSSTGEPDWHGLAALFGEWRPVAVAVGLPLGGDGDETDMSRAARAFGEQLEKRYGRPVYYVDERLTSAAAETRFAERRAAGTARRKDARRLDAVAAKIILENWLQSLPDNGRTEPA